MLAAWADPGRNSRFVRQRSVSEATRNLAANPLLRLCVAGRITARAGARCRKLFILLHRLLLILSLALLAACGEAVPQGDASSRILLLGDSMMAWNRPSGRSVGQVLEAGTGEDVVDRSVIGARYFWPLPVSGGTGLRLTAQYREGDWDWVVLNGGGNDLLFGCACSLCTGVVNRLISEDGRSGTIPAFVKSMRNKGARVLYVGYMRNPGVQTPVKGCGPAANELDARLARLDLIDPGFAFVPVSDLVPWRDTSYHDFDLIHPSPKGSREIALRILQRLYAEDREPG
jgi:acyl-CoA thioesterase-1